MVKMSQGVYEVQQAVSAYWPLPIIRFFNDTHQCHVCNHGFRHEPGWWVWKKSGGGRCFVCRGCAPTAEEAHAHINCPDDEVRGEWIKRFVDDYRMEGQ